MSARGSAPSISVETLPSGLRLVTETMPEVHSVALAFWVGSGSRDEPAEIAGASHFLEHLLFKGTATRSASAIAEALDEVGGDCNAYTTKEYTVFYVRLLAEHLDLGLDILSEIMWDPALAESDLEAERSVILDEILNLPPHAQQLLLDFTSSAATGRSAGRGRSPSKRAFASSRPPTVIFAWQCAKGASARTSTTGSRPC